MPTGVDVETVLVAGYAALLVAIAAILELGARRALRRAEQYQTAGFAYHRGLDVWECPQGERLHRHEVDHARRTVRYRAPAHACNACPLKPQCTDSDDGRELESYLGSWLESEIGRFHRGLSVALLFLAALILVIEMARHEQPNDLLVLGSVLAPICALGLGFLQTLWTRTPTAPTVGDSSHSGGPHPGILS